MKAIYIVVALGLYLMLGSAMSDQAGSITGAANSWSGGSINPTSEGGYAEQATGMAGWTTDSWMNFLFNGLFNGDQQGFLASAGPGSNSAASSSINSGLSSFTGSGDSGGNFGF
jgi:hypothetical protein